MAEKFEIGEAAIYVRPGSPCYGEEVMIIDGPRLIPEGSDLLTQTRYEPFIGYVIYAGEENHPQGIRWATRPEWLRKKKPPRREIDQIVSWEDCLWKPSVVTA